MPGSPRYHHLDALRGTMMMWGVLVHTSTLGFAAFFSWAAFISGLVRMNAFFIVSGFLAYLLVEKYGSSKTVLKRVLSIGVPLIVCLILLNPLTNYLVYSFHNEPIPFFDYLRTGGHPDARGPMVWSLHLWFLMVLLVYGLLTPVLKSCTDSLQTRVVPTLESTNERIIFSVICASVAILCLLGRLIYEFALEGILPGPLLFTFSSILYYLPFFALGMMLFRSKRMLQAFSTVQWFHLLLSCASLWAVRAFFDYQPKWLAETLQVLVRAYTSVALSGALFWLFGKLVPTKNTIVTYLSDAAYSVYLFHYLIIYLLATFLSPVLGSGELLQWIVAPLTLILALTIHHFAILRSPLLRALFNGKFPSVGRKPSANPATAPGLAMPDRGA